MTATRKKSAAAKAPSPMMRHFLQVKADNPDSLILYRCGDFYETFYEDARVAARELDITLTSRDKNSESPVPMAGVPYHAANQYITRLIEKGYKVAIVEQMEDPKQAKGMVKRDVARIVTPGLVLEQENLSADENNYLVSIWPDEERSGLAALDISTGEFRCTEVHALSDLHNELIKLTPREALLPDSAQEIELQASTSIQQSDILINRRPNIEYDLQRAEELLCRQFQTDSLKGFGVENMDSALRAAGALLSYVQDTQKQHAGHIVALLPYAIHDFMVLDETTKTNLELERTIVGNKKQGSLLGILDRCRTPLGSRTLKQWLNYPLLDLTRIKTRQNVVEELFLHGPLRDTLREMLHDVGDISRLSARITMNRSNARDLASLRDALLGLRVLHDFLETQREDLFGVFTKKIDPLPELCDELIHAIADDPPLTVREGRMFRKGYTAELDELIDLAEHGKDKILSIEAKERQATGVPSLKVRYNKVFGYYIELSKANAEKAPEYYIRKQTLTNAERFITPELKEFEDQVLHAEERRNELEYRLFELLREKVSEKSRSLTITAGAVGALDALANFAEIAAKNDYVRPEVTDGDELRIVDGRHPVVEALQKGEPFIPNDTLLDADENQLLIVTGPNMAGKSTVMRQVALIALLAQIGSFVPARQAQVGVTDRIFTRVGASDSLVRGLSTFMVEMTETSNILHNATKQSLIVLDEIGRGTSTYDGLSIAWAVAEYIHDRIGARTMFATHYHELTELARLKSGVRNMNIAVKEWEEQIIFLRKLVDGATNRSYGIQVGRLAGLPGDVVQRAKQVLENLESGGDDQNGLPVFGRHFGKGQDPNQLSLFTPRPAKEGQSQEHPILDELDRLTPDTLSPLDALNLLFDWKQRRTRESKE